MNDVVNSPEWYVRNGVECIDVLEETQGIESVKSFCICNAIKYLYRHKNKNGIEDIKKAIWYLNKYISLCDSQKDERRAISCDIGKIKTRLKGSDGWVYEEELDD